MARMLKKIARAGMTAISMTLKWTPEAFENLIGGPSWGFLGAEEPDSVHAEEIQLYRKDEGPCYSQYSDDITTGGITAGSIYAASAC